MTKLPILLQAYSIREDAEKDYKAAFKKVKDMGYDGIELAGLYGVSPEELKAYLDEIELPAISAHVPYLDLVEDLEGTLDQYVTLGTKYIAIPYLLEEYRPGMPKFAEVMEWIPKIAHACNQRGMTLLYHNHDFEFVKMEDGRYALDYMYETIGPDLLQVEPDTCWINVAGEDPVAYIKKYEGRVPVVHLKDFILEGDPRNLYELIGVTVNKEEGSKGRFEFRPLGEGQNCILDIAKAAGEIKSSYVVVEQDMSLDRPALEAVEASIKYLKANGF